MNHFLSHQHHFEEEEDESDEYEPSRRESERNFVESIVDNIL